MSKNWTNLLEDEDEDAIFARIQEESFRHYQEVELPRRLLSAGTEDKFLTDNDCGETSTNNNENLKCTQSENILHLGNDVFYRGSEPGSEGFHLAAGQTYIYPTNFPLREYQVNIVRSALFHNTLVCLPTGLGKTFIAAVVMYNYYRWFPRGKIVFMAPTKPLVSQQIRACYDIMAIPQEDTIEMTGTLNPIERAAYWKSRRVFFLTPQVLANDLRSRVCPAKSFKCVVVDEAHRATKEYAYCQVVRALEDANATFRILALSATPGNNPKGVVEVVKNLRISKLEMRGEESLDVSKYIHTKNVQTIVVQLSQDILDVKEQFLNIFDKYARSLRESRIVTTNINNVTKFQLLKAGERIKSRPPSGMSKTALGYLMSDLTVCMSLAHALELLQIYGLRAFQFYLTVGNEDGDKSTAAFTRLKKDGELYELLDKLQKMLSKPEETIWSHPKFQSMVDVLQQHFSSSEQSGNTKAIIFCQYRVVVSEVFDILQKLGSVIKPIMFVGQSSSKEKCGLPQKKQLQVMKSFRNGEYNVLIATCVAEEGLDIGAVDLLILMEAHRSPVRLVQRLGRTGRHRKGQCLVLLTQGKEVQKFKEAMETRKSYITTMMNSPVILANMYENEPSMLPPGVKPKQKLLHIRVVERQTPSKSKKQTDIRSAFSTKQPPTIQPPESPFLSPDQIAEVVEELGTTNVNFGRIHFSNSSYLWNRIKERPMNSEELFTTSCTYLSEWNDWNRTLQPNFEVGHSSDSEILCHLLNKADFVQIHEFTDSGLNSQVCINQLLTRKDIANKKKKREDKIKQKTTSDSNKNVCANGKMDIRNCLALAGEKTKLAQQKLLDEFNLLSQKNKLDKTVANEIFVDNTSEVLRSPDLFNDDIQSVQQCKPINSKCIFLANQDLNTLAAAVVSPKLVKPTSACYPSKLFHLQDLNNISAKTIQEFNIHKAFNKIKCLNSKTSLTEHKLMAQPLIDIKNTLNVKRKSKTEPFVSKSIDKSNTNDNIQSKLNLLHSEYKSNVQSEKINCLNFLSNNFVRENMKSQLKICDRETVIVENFGTASEKKDKLVFSSSTTDGRNVCVPEEEQILDISEKEQVHDILEEGQVRDIPEDECIHDIPEEGQVRDIPEDECIHDIPEDERIHDILEVEHVLNIPEEEQLFDITEKGHVFENSNGSCKLRKRSDVLLKEDVVYLTNIQMDTEDIKNQLKYSDKLNSVIVNENEDKLPSETSASSDIVDLDDLFTEEMENFSSTPKPSRQKSDIQQNSLSKKQNGIANSFTIEKNTLLQNNVIQPKQQNTNEGKVDTFLESDFVGIDELFDDDFISSPIKNTSKTKNVQNNIRNFPINGMTYLNEKKEIRKSNLSSTFLGKSAFNKNTGNLNSFKSIQASTCSSQENKLVDFKIPEEKINLDVAKMNSLNANNDNVSDLELSPILSGRLSQANNTIYSNLKLRKRNLFPERNPSQVLEKDKQPDQCQLNTKINKSMKGDSSEVISSKVEAEVDNDSNWSVSQLFEDSDNGHEKSDEEDQSMYTISQLVEKASEVTVSKNNKDFQMSFQKDKSEDEKTSKLKSSVFMLDTSDDDIFDNITEYKIESKNKNFCDENSYSSNDTFSSKISPSILKNDLTKNSDTKHLKLDVKNSKQTSSAQKKNLDYYKLNSGNILKNLEEIEPVNKYDFCSKKNETTASLQKVSFSNKIFSSDEKYKTEPLLSSGWMNNRAVSTCLKENPASIQWLKCSDSDTNSDIFESPISERKKIAPKKNPKNEEKAKPNKESTNAFVVKEADVSGPQMSSDEENTSGLDDLDESFIDDCTQKPNTSANQTFLDIHSVYLQATRSPMRRPGCFKIPNVRHSMLERDVFSQAYEEPDTYVNDSFCVDETEMIDNDPSVLEVAELILESKRNRHKRRKRKRKRNCLSSDSSSEDKTPKKVQHINDSLPLRRKKRVCRIESDSETDIHEENN